MTPTPSIDERFLSTHDLADRYQVSVASVHQWLSKGTAPRSMKIGRHRRFRLDDVLSWEASRADSAPLDAA